MHFRIELCRVILLLRCFFLILCLRKEALLQIGDVEERWWVAWRHCNLRVDWPWKGEQSKVWVRIISCKRWAIIIGVFNQAMHVWSLALKIYIPISTKQINWIWALTAASAATLWIMATADGHLCIFITLRLPYYRWLITHPFDYLIFAFLIILARHLAHLLFKILLLTLPEPVWEVTPRGANLWSVVVVHISWCYWLLVY